MGALQEFMAHVREMYDQYSGNTACWNEAESPCPECDRLLPLAEAELAARGEERVVEVRYKDPDHYSVSNGATDRPMGEYDIAQVVGTEFLRERDRVLGAGRTVTWRYAVRELRDEPEPERVAVWERPWDGARICSACGYPIPQSEMGRPCPNPECEAPLATETSPWPREERGDG